MFCIREASQMVRFSDEAGSLSYVCRIFIRDTPTLDTSSANDSGDNLEHNASHNPATSEVGETQGLLIEGIKYRAENISCAEKGVLARLQFVEPKLMALQNDPAARKTARLMYVKALRSGLSSRDLG